MAKNKQMGKTEVYPFWSIDDIKNMMNYFKMKEMWHWYWIFNAALLLGRRVSDTLSFKWSDFFYENGRMKDEIKEQKTGKVTRPYMCGACKVDLQLYIDKTGIDPMESYNGFIVTTEQKTELLENQEKYSEKEFEGLLYKVTQSQVAAYRKQFKIAADACNIQYPVSTHSTRKTFGYWSIKLYPYDVTMVDKLQLIFEHSDRNTTLKYSGIAREHMIKLYNDMGNFITDESNGKKPVIINSPVLPLKSKDFREILSKCWDMAVSGKDKFNGINNLIGLAEKCMI